MRRPLRKPHGLRNEDIENYEGTADYIVYTDGSNIVALNKSTGIETMRGTDFATVLQHAIDQQSPVPGLIVIKAPPTGYYTVNRTITIPDALNGLTLRGAGFQWITDGVLLKNLDDTVNPIIYDNQTAQSFNVFDRLGFYARSGDDIICLTISGLDTKVTNCSFYGDTATGIRTNTNTWVTGCWIEELKTGISIGGGCPFIHNNIFWSNSAYDIFCNSAADFCFISNNRSNASKTFFCMSVAGGAHKDSVNISGNIVNGCTDDCIKWTYGPSERLLIANNIFEGAGVTGYFLDVVNPAHLPTGLIQNNIIHDMQTGIFTGDISNLDIRNNVGYVSENGGATGAVADGGTFAHGLSGTPTYCVVTGTVAGDIIKVTGLGAANVTVSIKDEGGGAGTAQVLYWRAYL